MKRLFSIVLFAGVVGGVAALGTVSTLGCSGGSASAPGAKKADEEKVTRMPDVPDDGPAVSSQGKKWDGWRWKGKRNDCFYAFKNQCFSSKRLACKAAGCNTSDCRTKGGGPAHVSCR